MASSQAQVGRAGSGMRPLSFCFPVTWTTLAEPPVFLKAEDKPSLPPITPAPAREIPSEPTNGPVQPVAAVQPVAVQPVAVQPVAVQPVPRAPLPSSNDSWEMVVPKASRPGPRPSRIASSSTAASTAADSVKTLSAILDTPPVPAQKSVPELGLKTLAGFPRQSHLPSIIKFVLVAASALAIGGVVFFAATNRPLPAPAVLAPVIEPGPPLAVGLAGWITDFAPPDGSLKGRRISVLRASRKLTDFRLEFSGQIVSKALGWVIRAQDPKNFYVMKLEITKPIPQSTGVLSHFAVVNGQEQPRIRVPLSMPLRPNIPYNIRIDAFGNTFTAWVQGQKIDQWVDAQIREGGVGLYTELADRGTLENEMAVFPLFVKSPSRR
jgi:hypothetical protein